MNPLLCEMCQGKRIIPGPMEHPHLMQPCPKCSRTKKPVEVKFDQGKAGEPNRNKRVYTEETLRKAAEAGNKLAAEGRALGQIGNPDDGKTKISMVSHKWNPKFRVEKGQLIGELEILDTPQGRILEKLMESANEKVVMRPRGFGSLNPRPDGTMEVGEDYQVTAFDITVEPPEGV